MISLRSIRVRLAAWYLAVLVLSLVVLGAGMWMGLRWSLLADVDADLNGHLAGLQQWLHNQVPAGQPEKLPKELREYAAGMAAGYFLRVWDQEDRLLFASPGFAAQAPPGDGFRNFRMGRKRVRGISRVLTAGGVRCRVEVAASLELVHEILELAGEVLLWLIPGLLLLALAGGYWMSRRALQPVDQLTQAARNITLHNLSQRLAVPATGDELQRLSETLNQMLERLESSVRRITQFTADASHELRTPMAMVRAAAELALRRPRSAGDYREALAHILADIDRASQLVEDLLILARADAGDSAYKKTPVELGELVAETCRAMQPAAEGKGVAIGWEALPDPARRDASEAYSSLADRGALRRLFLALIDNAVKYTPAGGQVRVALRATDSEAVVEIADNGSGIAPEDLPRVFDRFYRADKARTSENGGFGLGLPIAREIAEAHGGRIEVESTLGHGSRFRVRLPRLTGTAGTHPQITQISQIADFKSA
jgi:heavy metal sensor kinase